MEIPVHAVVPALEAASFSRLATCFGSRTNVLSYLPERAKVEWRRKLQRAYAQPTYEAAKSALQRGHRELRLLYASAAASLLEGLEETLTVHRLGVPDALRVSLRTTNVLESIMAQVEHRTAKVDHWRTTDQKQRWCAAAPLQIELRLWKVKGYRYLKQLQLALRANRTTTRDAAWASLTGEPSDYQLRTGLTHGD
jgi:transposase-like protein